MQTFLPMTIIQVCLTSSSLFRRIYSIIDAIDKQAQYELSTRIARNWLREAAAVTQKKRAQNLRHTCRHEYLPMLSLFIAQIIR